MTTQANASLVEVAQLAFTFPGRNRPTLHPIDCTIPAGSFCLLAGVTGSGKSCFLRCLAGLVPHHSGGVMEGRVQVCGCDTRDVAPAQLAAHVALVLQSPDDQLCATTPAAEVAFGLENLALPPAEIARRIEAALARFALSDQREQSSQWLSGGQKQRLLLAAVWAMQPRLLLLDEPLSQLDPASTAEFLAELVQLNRQGLTIIMAEHRLDEVLPLADRLLALDEGRLVIDVARAPGDDTTRGVWPATLAGQLADAGLLAPEVMQLAAALDLPTIDSPDELATRLIAQRPATGGGNPSRPSVPNHSAPRMHCSGTPAIVMAERLAYRYPRRSADVWREVSFSIGAGECVAVVGPNGVGKSTLLAVLAGLLQPRAGRMAWPTADRPGTGLVMQNPDLMLFAPTVFEELAFAARRRGLRGAALEECVAQAARRLGVAAWLDEPPQALSQGQRLRVALAATLTLSPSLLLLDEPTTGQDQREVARLMTEMAAAARRRDGFDALLFASHDLRSVCRYADRVLVMADRRLAADVPPTVLIDNPELLARAGCRLTPLWHCRQRLGLRGWNVESLADQWRHPPFPLGPGGDP